MPKNPVRKINVVTTFPSPVGGLNARDTLMTMPPEDAALLRNMVVEAYGVKVRNGSQKHALNLAGEVETLLTWQSGTGSKMWAMIYNGVSADMVEITTAGDYSGATPDITGLTNAQWRQVNFANSGGQHLVAVNGADDGIWYSSGGGLGTRITAGDGVTSGTISGVDPKDFISVCVHQKRLWFVEKNTMHAWYLPADQVYGVAAMFDFGPLFSRGGYLVGCFTWSKNTYSGPQSQFVAVTSEGEMAVYAGIDPSSADTWSLVSVQYIGAPVGYNFGENISGDLLLLTDQQLLSMNLASETDVAGLDSTKQPSAKIHKMLNEQIRLTRDEYGWQVIDYPNSNLLIINTPDNQIVANKITQAWSECVGFAAICWRLFRNDLFYGDGDGNVYHAFYGFRDKVELDGTGGEPIDYEAQQAFSLLEGPGLNKYVSMMRPTLLSRERVSVLIGVLFDYKSETVLGILAPLEITEAFWDEDLWDSGIWSGGLIVDQQWVTVGGIGYAAAVRIKGSAAAETYWIATDWIFEAGPGL